jgi:adenylate kinase
MLKRSKPRLAMKYLSECDLIIYDLHAGNPTDVRRALEALKKYKSEDEKVLILISSLMAWQGTPKNLEEIKTQEQLQAEEEAAKKQQEGANEEGEEENQEEKPEPEPSEKEDEEEGAEQEESQPPEEEEVIEPPKKERKRYKHLPYTELDYQKRSPISEYQIIKDIEDEVLNFKNETGNVKTYVISAGILYGKGEAIFNQHIKKAWLQDPVRLPYVGDGDNLLPTIHVTDLARMVKAVFEKKPNRKYIFAIDNNKKPTQKKLIAAISNGIGTGLIESIDVPETFKKAHPQQTPIQLDLDWKKSLLLDLKVTPSSLFIKPEDP